MSTCFKESAVRSSCGAFAPHTKLQSVAELGLTGLPPGLPQDGSVPRFPVVPRVSRLDHSAESNPNLQAGINEKPEAIRTGMGALGVGPGPSLIDTSRLQPLEPRYYDPADVALITSIAARNEHIGSLMDLARSVYGQPRRISEDIHVPTPPPSSGPLPIPVLPRPHFCLSSPPKSPEHTDTAPHDTERLSPPHTAPPPSRGSVSSAVSDEEHYWSHGEQSHTSTPDFHSPEAELAPSNSRRSRTSKLLDDGLRIPVIPARVCIACKSTRSPCWRPSWSSDAGQLCNSCGLRYKKTGVRCADSKCSKIPSKGEWATMLAQATFDPNGQPITSCLKCNGPISVECRWE